MSIEEEILEEIRNQLKEEKNSDIATLATGFHFKKYTKNGEIFVPVYEDLMHFFDRKKHYKVLGDSGICYVWHGNHYIEYSDVYIKNFAQEMFEPKANNKKVSEFKDLILRTNLKSHEWFESTTERKINFKNGILDLDTGDFYEHSPEFGFRYVLEYDYNPEAQCPIFDKVLKDVTINDNILAQILLEFAGYAISSDSCWAHKALILEGSGSNGKSTFMNCLRSLAGRDNYSNLTLSDLKSEGNRQMLDGRLFNLAEETPAKGLMDSSLFKNLVTGGETIVRQIYKRPYSMRNRAKMIFACNELPYTYDTSKGFIRRFIIVPFRAYFDPQSNSFDPHIDQKLLLERPGIFNRVYQAYRDLKGRGRFLDSEAVKNAVDDYQKEINPLLEWVEDNLDLHEYGNGHDHRCLTVSEIYAEFSSYMKENGYSTININLFGRKLRDVIPDLLKRKSSKRFDNVVKKVLLAVDWKKSEIH